MKNYIISFAVFLVSVCLFASPAAFAVISKPSEIVDFLHQPLPSGPLKSEFCPAVNTLSKTSDDFWVSTTGWKSTNPSFLKKIQSFLGAKWIGVNLGEVVCVYGNTVKKEFPVNLHRPLLVVTPSSGKWTEEKSGHKVCISNNVEDCPFAIHKASPTEDVYKQLDFFKDQPVENHDEQ